MSRKTIIAFLTSTLLLISTPALAGEDWAWTNGLYSHPKYYVMNIENEGFFYDGCYEASQANVTWKLQVKLNGKKSKWKTVATAVPVFKRYDNAFMQKNGWYVTCNEPNNPVILVYPWNPPNWQKDYPARTVSGKKNNVEWTGSIVIHPNLKKIKPYT
jgi:hypothetical protein